MKALFISPGLVLWLMMPQSAMPTYGDPVRILPLGDSITHGYYSGGIVFNSYRKELKSLLDGGGYSTDLVGNLVDGDFADNQHEGHDGWQADEAGTTNDILGQVDGWMADTDADIVLLHVGTNDILDDGEDADEVSDILDVIFGANSNATVVLALIISVKDNHNNLAPDISAYNSNLNSMAQARIGVGDDIIVVDMETGADLDYTSSDMADFYHPSPSGYDKMATNWYPAVIEAIAHQAARNAPYFTSVSVSNDTVMLAIDNLTSGATIRIERSLELATTNWTLLDTIVPTGISTSWTGQGAISNETAFYRLASPAE